MEAGAKNTGGNAGTFMGVGLGMQMGREIQGGAIIPPAQPQAEQGNKMACPKCGAMISKKAKFCPECGEKIDNLKKFCPECGAEVTPKQKFCPECGTKLG